MSSTMESQIVDAFANLGSKSALANGFRLQAKGQQTVAVYFSGNELGNSVEIGLNLVALAPMLGMDESALRRWIADQAALTGRSRTQNGQRGTYPGVAFGNQQELVRFLEALKTLRAEKSSREPSVPTEKVRIEKAAQDAGFDLSAPSDGDWLVFRSTAFPQAVGVSTKSGKSYRVGIPESDIAYQVCAEFGATVVEASDHWSAIIDGVAGYQTLHGVLVRIAAVFRVVAGAGLRDFEEKRRKLPDTTEAVRLAVQRVGQDIFRSSLLDYWGRRCAVSGLNIPEMLRASHIKRWAECSSDEERLDVFNGLLLAPHLDALFDGGWITFSDSGQLVIADALDSGSRTRLGLTGSEVIHGLANRHCAYLLWHRQHRFRHE